MGNPEMYECIFVIGQDVDDGSYSWMISLLDYDRVKAVTVFNFEDYTVTLHEAGGYHHLKEMEDILGKVDKRELMTIVLISYLVKRRQDIYRNIFEGEQLEQLPQVAFISISSHSWITGLNPWHGVPGGCGSETSLLTNWGEMLSRRDEIRKQLSPECVVKLWGCQGIEGDELPARTVRACLQLDWDEKQGNTTFFDPGIYNPPSPPIGTPERKKYVPPTFYEVMRRSRRRLDEALREEFDYLTARNIIKYVFFGENPELIVPADKDTKGTLLNKKKTVKADYMKDHIFYPVALALFLNRPVIASRFGLGSAKHVIRPDMLAMFNEIKDRNLGNAFPGLGEYFRKADGEISMPVDVECEVLDLLISCWVTPPESIQVPSVLLPMDFPSERYVVFRPDVRYSLSNVEFPGRSASPEKPSLLDYDKVNADILEKKHILTYPGIDDY